MTRQTQLASDLWPLLLPRLERWSRELGDSGGASGSVEVTFTGTVTNDQGPQFLLRDGTRSLLGNMAVASGVTIDGVDISAHAADASAHHAPVTAGTLIALSGQQVGIDTGANHQFIGTGTGTAAAWRALSGLAGNGLSHTASVLAVALSATSGLELTGTAPNQTLQIRNDLAGNGLSMASKVLAVALATNPGLELTGTSPNQTLRVKHTTDIVRDASGLSVWRSIVPTWAGVHTFNARPVIANDLLFSGAHRTISTSSGHTLTLAPTAADLILNPGGVAKMGAAKTFRSDVHTPAFTGIAGFDVSDRGGNFYQMTIGGLKVDELYAKTFVADETRVDRGAELWSKSYGVVESDFTLPALESTVDVWFEDAAALTGDIFSTNDWLLLRGIEWGTSLTLYMVWFQITTRVTASSGGRQRWRLRRKSGGTTGQVITARSIMIDVGVAGQGTIELSALVQDKGPFIRMGNWATNPYTPANWTHRVQMGHLDGVAGYGAGKWGFAAGKSLGATASAFEGLLIEATDGAALYNTPLKMYISGSPWLEVTNTDGIRFLRNASSPNEQNRILWDSGVSTNYGRVAFSYTSSLDSLAFYAQHATQAGLYLGSKRTTAPANYAEITLNSGTTDTGQVSAATIDLAVSGAYGMISLGGSRMRLFNESGKDVQITAQGATNVGLLLQAAASPTVPVFRVTNSAGTSRFAVDASVGRIGVNQDAPAYSLDVTGTGRITGATIVGGTLAVTGIATLSAALNGVGATFSGALTANGGFSVGSGNAVLLNTWTAALVASGLITGQSAITTSIGYRVNGAAASGQFLRGNGTNFVGSVIGAADIPTGATGYIQNQTTVAQSASLRISGTAEVAGFGGSWTAVSFATGWANFGDGTFDTAAYRKFGNLVAIKGLVKATSSRTSPATVFTLPAGFRPAMQRMFNQRTSNAAVTTRVDITSAGAVRVVGQTTGTDEWVSLDIVFMV